ncbi:MAG: heterodisulfide reductase-related iron-sulfur binding cluster [Planctomycetota bacterium]|nr:heterodisulfide reductase-related iron-sulfur binding cluster [Planctomycetota bacterium]
MDDAQLIDYTKSLDCIHCGLCLNSCPTYQLTGAEPSSPRGRIHLMRAVAEGTLPADDEFAAEMDFCLLCRACESACPSGVQFGALMEHTRFGLDAVHPRPWSSRLARWVGFRVILPSRFMLKTASFLGRLAQSTGAVKALAKLAGSTTMRDAPSIPPFAERMKLPDSTPARGTRREVVAVLQGCIAPELFGRVNRATVNVLAHCGVESRVPSDHVCCGSLHAHNGDREGARALARSTIESFERVVDEHGRSARVVVNSAGCGAHMKEYAALFENDLPWRERALRFSARVVDFTQFLGEASYRTALGEALAPTDAVTNRERITWDDPCHLCHAQKIRTEPRTLLDLVATADRVEMHDAEGCCGSAGIYSLLRPVDAAAVLEPKLSALEATHATTLVTANPGCQLQWSAGIARSKLDVRVVHIAEFLDEALSRSNRS